ncbi:MAG: M3 family metallopeptidase [Candidatus Marinimicrobia bacterium]|nr:M3 family metallopeptidase [Candidatus Neomarinimicrobiota bacterium]
MKYQLVSTLIAGVIIMSCTSTDNPFFTEWDTPFQVPPFQRIETKHYRPALLAGIEKQSTEIEVIINNPEAPSFKNTIEAFETTGQFLERVENVFDSISSTDATDELDNIEREFKSLKSHHRDDILLDEKLFQRIKNVYNKQDRSVLTIEQNTLLNKIYQDFVRNGANLTEAEKVKLRRINEDLALLTMEFAQNIRKEVETWEMVLNEESDLIGLPERVVTMAAQLAEERGKPGKWLFTLDKPSWIPFLQFSERRDLREKIYMAYINRGNNNDQLDNKARINKIVNLRIKRVNLLGYATYADYVLERSMAKNPAGVYELLNKLWEPALRRAKNEAAEFQAFIDREDGDFQLQSWDWWYYAEKVRKEKYNLDENQLRSYFEINNVRDGAFAVANKLYGITFTERSDIPVYHPEAKVFEVYEADGTHLGILYIDYHPRVGKYAGAWASGFRSQSNRNDHWVTPITINVCNLSRPTGNQPALISFSEVEILFHEFGHALHGLLRTRTYTDQVMPRDFVELPSQIMENWAAEPAVLKLYAHHYQTNEPLPDELIDKLRASRLHNQGFIMTEYLAASILDMDWHTLTESNDLNPIEFENASFKTMGLIPEIISRYRSPYFNHIFSGGYSAGYYSYIWAQVLDADAFQAFKDTDLFNQELAARFRKYVLGLSGTRDAMEIYREFRGQDPQIEPLLVKRGLFDEQ